MARSDYAQVLMCTSSMCVCLRLHFSPFACVFVFVLWLCLFLSSSINYQYTATIWSLKIGDAYKDHNNPCQRLILVGHVAWFAPTLRQGHITGLSIGSIGFIRHRCFCEAAKASRSVKGTRNGNDTSSMIPISRFPNVAQQTLMFSWDQEHWAKESSKIHYTLYAFVFVGHNSTILKDLQHLIAWPQSIKRRWKQQWRAAISNRLEVETMHILFRRLTN